LPTKFSGVSEKTKKSLTDGSADDIPSFVVRNFRGCLGAQVFQIPVLKAAPESER
jgi:hypothetical protein